MSQANAILGADRGMRRTHAGQAWHGSFDERRIIAKLTASRASSGRFNFFHITFQRDFTAPS
jgi:hypothetical protein